ncbi:MAG: serine/threonine protein kinase [Alphaproteobacteria bacterium]|nr:serine/threonine protein kinase [Alphaproteobacteria bacterium]
MTFGKYFLVDKIATGGMAEIFKAKTYGHGGFENLLVIKRILPHVGANQDFVEMFIDEAKVSVALQHPNIVRVYDFGQILDDYFIAMECVEGKDVRGILQKHAKAAVHLEPAFAAYLAHEVCKGLHYAHTKADLQGNPYGIVHRDISPSNVLVSYDGQVKIADFGIAKAESNAYQTRDGVLKGKFEYMSPEQAEGQALDARSDIFAAGILLWESLTGHRLFKTDSDVATLRAIQSADVPLPRSVNPDVPEALEAIAMRALSRYPADRYPDAAAMADELRAALVPETPDGVRVRFQRYLEGFFADEIAEERARLRTNTEVAQQLRSREGDWDGPTTSMRPHTPPEAGMRLGPVLLLLFAVLAGTVGLAVAGMAVVVGMQMEDASGLGDLDIVVEPDARVYVDDVLRGTGATVVVSRLEAGEHVVRLEADGYQSVELRVGVTAGDALRLEKVLEPVVVEVPDVKPDPDPVKPASGGKPVARPARVRIESDPPGATVLVDGTAVGTAPVTWAGTPGQTVSVRLELAGHRAAEGPVTVGEAGSTVSFSRALPDASQPGKLTVLLVGGGWANVFVDGAKLPKTAPLRDFELAPGPHEIRVSNEGLGIDHTESVTVGSGGTVTVRAAPN